MTQTRTPPVWVIGVWGFVFVSDFVFRISDFYGANPKFRITSVQLCVRLRQ
jgi:hypothetical protein